MWVFGVAPTEHAPPNRHGFDVHASIRIFLNEVSAVYDTQIEIIVKASVESSVGKEGLNPKCT